MKAILVLIMLVLFQNPTPPGKEPVRLVSPRIQAEILKEQLAQSKLQGEFQACQGRNWGQDYNAHQGKIVGYIDEAFKEVGLDKKDWDINMDTFEFVKKAPVPAAPAAAPAKQKP